MREHCEGSGQPPFIGPIMTRRLVEGVGVMYFIRHKDRQYFICPVCRRGYTRRLDGMIRVHHA